MGWGCSGIGTSLTCNGLATAPIMLGGSEEIKQKYLGMLTEDFKLASFCLTEPDAGSDVSGMRTTRREDGRQVRPQRLEVLHHERQLRGLLHRLREDRQGSRPQGHLGFRRRAQLGRRDRGQEGGQARTARLQHRHDLVQRRRGARREPARRGEPRLQARDDDARPHAPGRGGHGSRHRPLGVRVRDRVLEGARAVRRADRDAPGDPVHDRRHGDQGRGRDACSPGSRLRCSTRASATRSPRRTPSASPRTPRWRSRPTPCRSTAATASSRSTRSRS